MRILGEENATLVQQGWLTGYSPEYRTLPLTVNSAAEGHRIDVPENRIVTLVATIRPTDAV